MTHRNALARVTPFNPEPAAEPVRLHVSNPALQPKIPQPTSEPNSRREFVERAMDIALASALGIVFCPIAIAATLLLARSGGPVLFKQQRVGRGGREFSVYKFRTMVPDAATVLEEVLARDPELRAEWQRDFKLKNDPRVTPIGRFLRKTSLDELPQLWNIIRGDMSLVGPRPIEPFELSKYGRFVKHYYAQRPGLTGLWQVSGRSNTSYERRVVLDAYYSKNRSLMLDISIIFKTVRVVLKGQGAC